MKIRLCLFLSLWLGVLSAQQENDSLLQALVPTKARPYLFVKGSLGGLSNSVSTTEFLDVTGKSFLGEADKEELLSPAGRMRFGYVRQFEVGYRQPYYKVFDVYQMGQGFSIRNNYYSTAGISEDMAALVMYGNGRFAGETLDLSRSQFEAWYYTNLQYHFDVLVDSTYPISLSAGLVIGHDHHNYNLRDAELYTDPDGEYLDMMLDYHYQENRSDSYLSGLGLAIGAETKLKTGVKSVLHLQVQDLGAVYFTQGRSLATDSSFRFRGLQFSNVFDLNDSIINSNEEDFRETYYYDDEGGYVKLMPFRVMALHSWETEKTWLPQVFASAQYLHLGGYLPKLSLGGLLQAGSDHQFRVAVSGGGFYTVGLDAGYQWDIGRYWQFQLQVINLTGLVVPSMPGGSMLSGGLRYEL